MLPFLPFNITAHELAKTRPKERSFGFHPLNTMSMNPTEKYKSSSYGFTTVKYIAATKASGQKVNTQSIASVKPLPNATDKHGLRSNTA
jgi:hypothetical protein